MGRGAAGKGKRGGPPLHIRLAGALLNIGTPQLFTICKNLLHYLFMYLKYCWMSSNVDSDQMLCSMASDLVLHCLVRHVCPNTKGYYGIAVLYKFFNMSHRAQNRLHFYMYVNSKDPDQQTFM